MGIHWHGVPQAYTGVLAEMIGATCFVETGTFQGGTAAWASTIFKTVHTIEWSEDLYKKYSAVLESRGNIKCHHGSSPDVMRKLLPTISKEPTIFWLDAHYSGGITAGETDECPLLEEIKVIRETMDLSNVCILIDDARCFMLPVPKPHDPNQWPSAHEVLNALDPTGKEFFTVVFGDVFFAVPAKHRVLFREFLRNHYQQNKEDEAAAKAAAAAT
jgi:hypothetical protein